MTSLSEGGLCLIRWEIPITWKEDSYVGLLKVMTHTCKLDKIICIQLLELNRCFLLSRL